MHISELSNKELEGLFPNHTDFEHIKDGGEGSVFKAFSNILQDYVAVKIFYNDTAMHRTEYEVNKLKNIKLPYIAKILGFSSINIRGHNHYYTKSEFIDGIDLRELIKQDYIFSEEEVTTMIICISEAIQALWENDIVHCDINPNNIMKTNSGHFFLIDMGVAKHLDKETFTQTGMIMGTHGYMAPEQLLGRSNLTLKADFYSLGIVAYELLTNANPFANNQRLAFEIIEPYPLTGSDCESESLRRLITNMTKEQPYLRPLNLDMILKQLKE